MGFAGASKSVTLRQFGLTSDCYHFKLSAGRSVPLAATRIYQMSFFTGFGVSALIYYSLNIFFPAAGASATFEEVDVSAEDLDGSRSEHAVDNDGDSDYKKGGVSEMIRTVG